MKLLYLILLITINIVPAYGDNISGLTANQAYQIGKNSFLHLKNDKAKQYLKYAADHGNTNAMVRYAFLSSSSQLFLSPKAYDYMLKAAKKGHERAMISISQAVLTTKEDKKYWRSKFIKKMQPYINKNNPDALYLMSVLNQRDKSEREKWLIKATEAGSCIATSKLYWFYKKGLGWFLTKSRRKNQVAELANKAHRLGCLDGLDAYISWLDDQGNNKIKVKKITQHLIEIGDAATIDNEGTYSLPMNMPGMSSPLPVNYEKAAMYLKIYLNGFGKVSGLKDEYKQRMSEIAMAYSKLTAKQKKYVDSYVKKYLATHDIKIRDDVWETKFH